MIEPVSVLLPLHRVRGEGSGPGAGGVTLAQLTRAVGCVLGQTHGDLELLVVLNGADDGTRRAAREAVGGDRRARVIEVPMAGLSGALNAGMSAARHELIGRMDADDWCDATRLEKQARAMGERPELAGLGTAYEKVDEEGNVLDRVIPPCSPGELRWRLLLGNQFAHGSMVLRRSMVRGVGGYDERIRRAQDFDLWLRLIAAHPMANLPEVLYRYTASAGDDRFGSCPEQAALVVSRLTGLWRGMAGSSGPAAGDALRDVMSGRCDASAALGRLEDELSARGPSVEGLMGWLWVLWKDGQRPGRLAEAGKLSVLREAGRRLREEGVEAVWLWGAGRHTEWVLHNAGELGLGVLGVVDDARAGARVLEFTVREPSAILAGEVALISSDAWEGAIWERSSAARARGVDVRRLYTLRPGARADQWGRDPAAGAVSRS